MGKVKALVSVKMLIGLYRIFRNTFVKLGSVLTGQQSFLLRYYSFLDYRTLIKKVSF